VLALAEERPQTGWGLGREKRLVEHIEVQLVCSMILVKFDAVEVIQRFWAELE